MHNNAQIYRQYKASYMNKLALTSIVLGVSVCLGLLGKYLFFDGESLEARILISSLIGGLVAGGFFYWVQLRKQKD